MNEVSVAAFAAAIYQAGSFEIGNKFSNLRWHYLDTDWLTADPSSARGRQGRYGTHGVFSASLARELRYPAAKRFEPARKDGSTGARNDVAPLFFPRGYWIPQPTNWRPRTQTPVKYDLSVGEGRRVWDACFAQAGSFAASRDSGVAMAVEPVARYGDARLVRPRLGQATFRIAVLDAYGRGCAVTEEHSLPALEAAHIQPFAHDGPHAIANGLLLRADLHRLFDTGYVTVTPKLRLEVSARLKTDFHNGRSYYPLHGARVRIPNPVEHQPEKAYLEWHNEHVFRG